MCTCLCWLLLPFFLYPFFSFLALALRRSCATGFCSSVSARYLLVWFLNSRTFQFLQVLPRAGLALGRWPVFLAYQLLCLGSLSLAWCVYLCLGLV